MRYWRPLIHSAEELLKMPVLDLRYVKLPLPEAARSERELSPYELSEFQQLRDRRHRAGWMASRWLIKRLLRERMGDAAARRFDPTAISVLSRDPEGRACRPRILVNDRSSGLGLSISHTPHGVLVGLSRRDGLLLGVDLAQPQRTGVGSLDPWYTPSERQWIQHQAERTAAAQLWAVKQAFYKAANRGEVFAPRSVEVSLDNAGRYQCKYSRRSHGLPAYIAVTTCDDHVAALVVILPEQSVNAVPKNYDEVIPQSELMRIGRMI